MKREILFRGKRVDNGEWVYGCLVNNLWYYSENSEFKKGTSVCEIITGKYDGDCWEDISTDENCIVTVHPETVCQFTGLLDKNGIKIFEGDKLKNEFGTYVVEFADGSFWACNIDDGFNVPLCIHNFDSEIIGNIHDE